RRQIRNRRRQVARMDERYDGNDRIVCAGDGRVIALEVEATIIGYAAAAGFAPGNALLHAAQRQPVIGTAETTMPVKDRATEPATGVEHFRAGWQTGGVEQPV